mmetsp:Transcript_18352/g.43890  ORF Transcript_18352/g.43890 Transcript_18352/m.43890 type:complete len:284 (+) Transcript_18352:1161-2012(+)
MGSNLLDAPLRHVRGPVDGRGPFQVCARAARRRLWPPVGRRGGAGEDRCSGHDLETDQRWVLGFVQHPLLRGHAQLHGIRGRRAEGPAGVQLRALRPCQALQGAAPRCEEPRGHAVGDALERLPRGAHLQRGPPPGDRGARGPLEAPAERPQARLWRNRQQGVLVAVRGVGPHRRRCGRRADPRAAAAILLDRRFHGEPSGAPAVLQRDPICGAEGNRGAPRAAIGRQHPEPGVCPGRRGVLVICGRLSRDPRASQNQSPLCILSASAASTAICGSSRSLSSP